MVTQIYINNSETSLLHIDLFYTLSKGGTFNNLYITFLLNRLTINFLVIQGVRVKTNIHCRTRFF